MPVEAVTLDAAGTLIAAAEPVGRTYARCAARHGIALAPGDAERRFKEALAAAPPLAFPGADPRELPEHERSWWRAVVRQTFGAAARSASFEACFAELFAHYGRADAWRVFPEVPAALRALRARGVRLAVVSNFDARLRRVLAGLALAPLVDLVMHSGGEGVAKPDPAIFLRALGALGVSPGAALHAGDGLVADVGGARRAGMAAVLVDRGAGDAGVPPGTTRIATLAALPPIVSALP